MMRGTDETSGSLFSYVDLEESIPPRHPLRKIRQVVNDALASLDAEFEALYTDFGPPSIPPESLIRASLLQILFSVRSERQLMEQMNYNLMFRWFVGLGIDDPVWVPTVFMKKDMALIRPSPDHGTAFRIGDYFSDLLGRRFETCTAHHPPLSVLDETTQPLAGRGPASSAAGDSGLTTL